jgi:hypothetical protein
MNEIERRVLKALGETGGSSVWESLLALFKADREAFYLLACDGVGGEAAPRLVELAELARRIRGAVRGSFEIEHSGDSAHLVGPSVERTFIPANLVEVVRDFLLATDGKGIQQSAGKDYEGAAVSEAEVRFQVGERETWAGDRKAMEDRLDAPPLVLRVDTDDLSHLATLPAYVTFALKECSVKTVLAPTAVFKELNRGEGCPENLRGGWAFCGKPRSALDNSGQRNRAPVGMVFVVYADAAGYVFDWDWVEEDTHQPGCPVNYQIRFGDPVTLEADAFLVLPEQIPAPQFDWTKPCYSPRGDCIFCYITADMSYACRINADLTVFRSLAEPKKITGFKVKNVRRILDLDENIVLDADPDLLVSVQSVLLETLKGDKDADVRVYDVIIEAFRTASSPPPKVRVPKRVADKQTLVHA